MDFVVAAQSQRANFTRRFAEEAALSDLRKLETIQNRHDSAVDERDVDKAYTANRAFHDLIVTHSGNTEAIALRERYFSLSAGLRRRFGFGSYRWEAVRHEHHQMIDAFRRRDGMAAYAVASLHVRATMEELFSRINDGEA